MMSMPDDDRTAPRLSDPTEVDATDPFDSTGSGSPRQTQLSDPPTVLVRRESFRELPPRSVGEMADGRAYFVMED